MGDLEAQRESAAVSLGLTGPIEPLEDNGYYQREFEMLLASVLDELRKERKNINPRI